MASSNIKPLTLKQIISALLSALMMFSVMIKEEKFGKVELVVSKEVTTESENIVVEIRSYSLKKIDESNAVIEINDNGTWKEIKREYIYEIATVPSVIFLGKSIETIPVKQLSVKKFEAGEYRITKMIKVGSRSNFEPYTAYFTVTQAAPQPVTESSAA